MLLLALLIAVCEAASRGGVVTRHELSFHLESRLTCFWEHFPAGDKLRVNVWSHEERQLLLQLRVTSPSAALSEWSSGDRQASFKTNLTESGVYEVCVHSNSPTRVVLDLYAYNEQRLIAGVTEFSEMEKQGHALKTCVVNLHERLYQTLSHVKYSTLHLARDDRLQKKNSEYIYKYTLSFISLNLIIAALQVFLIRRFFRDPSPGKIRI